MVVELPWWYQAEASTYDLVAIAWYYFGKYIEIYNIVLASRTKK